MQEQQMDIAEVRILLVGDRKFRIFLENLTENPKGGVGKTSLLMSLLHDQFCDEVPARCETVLIPRDVSADGVLTQIMDYSGEKWIDFF